MLAYGHAELSSNCQNLDVLAVKDFAKMIKHSSPSFRLVFVDEAQRFYANQFTELIDYAKQHNLVCVFSYDDRQVLQQTEIRDDIPERITKLPNAKVHRLTGKIRANRELVSFIRRFVNLKNTDVLPAYPSVSILYANKSAEASSIAKFHQKDGYIFINYTGSSYKATPFDNYVSVHNTHSVVGQEFDKVLMIMDDTFMHNDDGILVGRRHPNANYLYHKLAFQAVTRVREKLMIIVVENPSLFKNLLSIKGAHFEGTVTS